MKSRLNEACYYNIVNNIIKCEFINVLDDYLLHWVNPQPYSVVNFDSTNIIKLIINTIKDNDLKKFKIDEFGTSFVYNHLLIRLCFS